MKKTTILLLSSAFLLLGGCANNSNDSRSESDTSSSSVSKASSSKKATSTSSRASSLVVNTDDETQLLTSPWQFNKFTIHQIEAEIDDGQLEVKVDWEPKTEKRANFANFGEIKATQDGKTLRTAERDDDFDEDETVRDLDVTYAYQNKTDPVTIQVKSADGQTHSVSFKLQ